MHDGHPAKAGVRGGALDGQPDAIRSFMRYLIGYWSGPDQAKDDERIDHLTEIYCQSARSPVARITIARTGTTP